MEIAVKNMVCARCVKAVTRIFMQQGLNPVKVQLGTVEIDGEVNPQQEGILRKELAAEGFEWLDDQKVKLIEEVKNAIVQLVHAGELDEMKQNLSDFLTSNLHKDYHLVSTLFSSIENTTIEQYFILQKIEKVKEWLVYNEFTLGEIAYKLGYSSTAHLSAQFKKVTGFTPSQFKKQKVHQRRSLDQV